MSLQKTIRLIFLGLTLFLALGNLINRLPHYPLHFLSWFSSALYFTLCLVCFFISRSDRYLREHFIHFSITFFLISLSLAIYFIGEEFTFGNAELQYLMYFYFMIITSTMLMAGVLHMVFAYLFRRLPRWALVLAAWFVTGLIQVDFLAKLSTVANFPFQYSSSELSGHLLRSFLIVLFSLLVYFVMVLKTHRPNGVMMHGWAIGLFLLLACDAFDRIALFWQINMYGIDQYFNIFVLIILNAVAFLRLTALASDSYQLMEQIIFDRGFFLASPVLLHDRKTEALASQIYRIWTSQKYLIQGFIGMGVLLLAGLSGQFFVWFKVVVLLMLISLAGNIYLHVYSCRFRKGQVLNSPLNGKSPQKDVSSDVQAVTRLQKGMD